MSDRHILERIPPLSIVVIALIGGIVVNRLQLPLVVTIGLLVFGLVCWAVAEFARLRYSAYLTMVGYVCTFCAVFAFSSAETFKEHLPISSSDKFVFCRVDDIQHKAHHTKLSCEVLGVTTHSGEVVQRHSTGNAVLVYVQNNVYTLRPGDVIVTPNKFSRILPKGNPDEFDYQSFLALRGCYLEAFINRSDVKCVAYEPTWHNRASAVRRFLMQRILQSDFTSASQSFLIAVLLGERTLLSEDIQDEFASVGIAHILALSGLHLSIILGLVLFLFLPVGYASKCLQVVLSLMVLCLYWFITGCPLSLTRALVMYICFYLGHIVLHRDYDTLSSLLLSVLLMLLYNPKDLFEVSFQLSVVAILAIILCGYIYRRDKAPTWNTWLWSLLAVSMMTSLCTSVLSVYYFHQFSLAFLLPNMLILPLLPWLIILALVGLFSSWSWAIALFDGCYAWMVKGVDWLAEMPYSHVSELYINIFEVAILYAVIAVVLYALYRVVGKKFSLADGYVSACIIICLVCVFATERSLLPSTPYELIVFNDSQQSYVATFNGGGRIALHSLVDSASLSRFQSRYRSLLVHSRISSIDTLGSAYDRVIPLTLSDGTRMLYINSLTFGSAKRKTTPQMVSAHRVKVDWVILSRHYHGAIADLAQLYDFSRVMLPADIFETVRKKYTDEVDSLNHTRLGGDKIILYDVASQGAYIRLFPKSE